MRRRDLALTGSGRNSEDEDELLESWFLDRVVPSCVLLLWMAGRLPAAFSLRRGVGLADAGDLAAVLTPSTMGETERSGVADPRLPPDEGEPPSREEDALFMSEVVGTAACELVLRTTAGLLLAEAVEATNFLGVAGFFLEGDMMGARFSYEGVTVLPDETMLASSSSISESGGDTNRAVGRGPEVDGPRGFLRIGWEGGGLAALDEELLDALSASIALSGSGLSGPESVDGVGWASWVWGFWPLIIERACRSRGDTWEG